MEISHAPTREEAERGRDAVARRYRRWYPNAVQSSRRTRLVTFHGFPEAHWKHLRTANVVREREGVDLEDPVIRTEKAWTLNALRYSSSFSASFSFWASRISRRAVAASPRDRTKGADPGSP